MLFPHGLVSPVRNLQDGSGSGVAGKSATLPARVGRTMREM
jgi:hypothetical protein